MSITPQDDSKHAAAAPAPSGAGASPDGHGVRDENGSPGAAGASGGASGLATNAPANEAPTPAAATARHTGGSGGDRPVREVFAPDRIRVVLNTASQGVTRERADRVLDTLALAFPDATLDDFSDQPLTDALADAAQSCDLLVVAGGDGTIAAAAEQVAGTEVVLGIVPAGTMNVFANDLQIQEASALDTIRKGVPVRVDVGRINGRPFLNGVVFGVFSDLAVERERLRAEGLTQALRIFWRGLMKLLRSRSHRYDLRSPDVHVNVRSRVLAIINNRLKEAPGAPFAREVLNGGVLDVYVSRDPSVFALPATLLSMITGRVRKHRQIASWEADAVDVRIRRRRAKVSVDGEVLKLASPFRCVVQPRALRVLVPPTSAAAATHGDTPREHASAANAADSRRADRA